MQRQATPATVDRVRAAAATVDWRRLCRLAEVHAVWAPLLDTVQRLALDMPAELRRPLEQRLFESTARNLAWLTQLTEILETFADAGVPAAVFKGPALAGEGRLPIGARASVDLDLLVSPAHARRAVGALQRRGYRLGDSGPDGLDAPFVPGRREAVLLPPGTDLAPVELQVTVASWPLAVRVDTDAILARADRAEVAGVMLPLLAPEDLVLTLALHGTREVWGRLRLIADIDAAVGRRPDWAVLAERARQWRISRMLRVALLLAHDLLATEIPAIMRQPAHGDPGATRLARQLAGRLFEERDDGANGRWESHVWARSRERLTDGLRCRARLLCWRLVIWRWDAFRRRRQRPRSA